jgi:hypothetical protein
MKIRLIDVLFLVVAASVGICSGFWLASRYGTLLGLFGFVLGFVAGLMSVFAFFWLLIFIASLFRPRFPVCREGKCSDRGYKFVEFLGDKSGVIFQCRCGGRYLMRSDSRPGSFTKAWEVCADGCTRPYMRYTGRVGIRGRWEDWQGEPTPD